MLTKKKKLGSTLAILAISATVFGFIADGYSTLGIISNLLKPILNILNYSVPIWLVIIGLIIFLGIFLFLLNRKQNYYNKKQLDSTLIRNKGHFYTKFQEILVGAEEKIIIVGLEKDWVFHLFISLFIARRKGVKIDVVYFSESHERYYLLKLLGCRVFHADKNSIGISFEGVIADSEQILSCKGVIHNPRNERDNAFGRYYFGSYDSYAIKALQLFATSIINNSTEIYSDESYEIPELVKVTKEEMIEKLKEVPFYKNAEISFEEIVIMNTFPVSSHVLSYKLNQVKEVFNLHEKENWKLFQPCGVKLPNGKVSIIIPPVLEEHENKKLYIAEGHSRFYTCIERGIEKVNAIVVRNVTKDLPLTPTIWNKVTKTDEKNELRNLELARYIETRVHKNTWVK